MENTENVEKMVLLGRMENEAKECVYSNDYDELNIIAMRVMSSNRVIGSVDEFHNFAVNYAQTDDKQTACEILKLGLNLYPSSVDLLADFIQYGVQCGREEECEKYFQKLQTIPKELWSWRGFDFSIDYLQNKLERMNSKEEYTSIRKDMLNLVASFREYMPFDERSYLAESYIYENSNKEIEILEKAMAELTTCPKCALRYADLKCERGEYEKALKSLEICINSLQTQPGINEGYTFFLSGLCKSALIHTCCYGFDFRNSLMAACACGYRKQIRLMARMVLSVEAAVGIAAYCIGYMAISCAAMAAIATGGILILAEFFKKGNAGKYE